MQGCGWRCVPPRQPPPRLPWPQPTTKTWRRWPQPRPAAAAAAGRRRPHQARRPPRWPPRRQTRPLLVLAPRPAAIPLNSSGRGGARRHHRHRRATAAGGARPLREASAGGRRTTEQPLAPRGHRTAGGRGGAAWLLHGGWRPTNEAAHLALLPSPAHVPLSPSPRPASPPPDACLPPRCPFRRPAPSYPPPLSTLPPPFPLPWHPLLPNYFAHLALPVFHHGVGSPTAHLCSAPRSRAA